MKYNDAIEAILAERRYQDQKWGGPANDDKNTEKDWQELINEYNNNEGRAAVYGFRKKMIKVAALALAAIESYDRLAIQVEREVTN